MDSAPGVSVIASPGWLWRAALWGCAAMAIGSTAHWAVLRADRLGAAATLAVAVVSALTLRQAARRGPRRLRWDGRAWWLCAPGQEPRAGETSVAIDLGWAMLLRFRWADPAARGRWRPVWLPLQRSDLEAEWHALRCALYSARPAAVPPAARERHDA